MAILASMLAYLGALTGIVVALLMSLDVLFYSPGQPASPQQLATAAKPSEAKPATLSASANGRWGPAVVHSPSQGGAVAKVKTAVDVRRKSHLANVVSRAPDWRRSARPDRTAGAGSWAYPPAPNVEPRAMGYAGESPFAYGRIW